MNRWPPKLPDERTSRVVVEAVRPVVDAGRFPAKASLDRPVTVLADVFAGGHEVVDAALRRRTVGPNGGRTSWIEQPMEPLGNDRFRARFVPDRLGRWEYDVIGWIDHAETWRRATVTKLAAGVDVELELQAGSTMIAEMAADPATDAADAAALEALAAELTDGVTSSLDADRWPAIFHRTCERRPTAQLTRPLSIDVDRQRATFGAWYEFFPRSAVLPERAPTTLRDARDRLAYIAAMGFDVVYVPPIHPIGTIKRKGRNNATTATDDDVGSPWAIGSELGGHTAVAPELGTVDDLVDLVEACRSHGMELALDIAFQCAPDHPWVSEHPEWFAHRADGSIQFAENPPKKYEDIYPLDFDTDDWQGLWTELADVFRHWIDRGVRTFRVDNPHTKALPFWEWAIATLRCEHPDLIFLAEAFTRPRVMERLAKVGFNQSYTYFAWRQSSWELREYFEDLSSRTIDYFRPNAWPNTPDILTEQLQTGGRPAFATRAVLAATLSPSWGVYGPAFELLEHEPVRVGSEEYLDSEKYQLREWELEREDSLAPLLARLNEIRREHPALWSLETLHFHQTEHPGLLCFSKTDPAGEGDPVLVVINIDPVEAHAGMVDIDLAALDLPYGSSYDVIDRLAGVSYRWSGSHNYVELSPHSASAHVFTVHPVAGAEDE